MWHGKASNPSLQMQLRKALQQHDEELTRLRAQTNVLETKEGFLWIFGAPGGWKCRQSLWWHCKSTQPSFSQTWNHFFGRDWIDLDWDVGCECEIPRNNLLSLRQWDSKRCRVGRIRSETSRWESSWRMLQSTKNVWMTVSFSPEPSCFGGFQVSLPDGYHGHLVPKVWLIFSSEVSGFQLVIWADDWGAKKWIRSVRSMQRC